MFIRPKWFYFSVKILFWTFLFLFPLLTQQTSLSYFTRMFGIVGLYVILALGLNITIGFAGLFDLGYMAFYAIGAYSAGLLSIHGFNFWCSTLAAIFITVSVRFILALPILKLSGDYLAIVTLGFGEIVRIVLNNWDSLTNGPKGLPRVGQEFSTLHFFGFSCTENIHFYYLILATVLLSAFVSKRLARSRIGRAWIAIREDSLAAELSGIPIAKMKMLAFVTSAVFAAVAGALFVHWERFVTPESFTFWESILVVSMVVLGGAGSISGVILGAVLVAGLPQLLQSVLGGHFIQYRYLLFGLALIFTIIFRPQGLIPSGKTSKLEAEMQP